MTRTRDALGEFVLARLDEVDALAVAASKISGDPDDPALWSASHPMPGTELVTVYSQDDDEQGMTPLFAAHPAVAAYVAWHDPLFVISDNDGKRMIVDDYMKGDLATASVLYRAVQAFAWPYREHPDYDARWSKREPLLLDATAEPDGNA